MTINYITRTNVTHFHDICYCTAYYSFETFFLQYQLFIKKQTMANQYIKVTESYRIVIPIILSHFSFLISQKYSSMFNVV